MISSKGPGGMGGIIPLICLLLVVACMPAALLCDML